MMDIFLITILISFLVFSVLFFIFCAYQIALSVIPMAFYGAVFAKSRPELIEKMILLANAKPGQKAVDIGSGSGELVIALAKTGAEAHGVEINPFLVWLSRKNIKKAGLSGKVFIHWKDFWQVDFSEFDIVTVYGISYMMKNLEQKLKKELKKDARVVSNYFIFPAWPPAKKDQETHLYIKQ